MLLNCGVGEDSWESLGLQGDPTSSSWRRSVLGVHWKDWCWSWNSNTLATSCEELTHWKRPWCWEGLWAGGEGDDRGWDDWMASPTPWTWVWVISGSWGWTGRPGMLWFMGSQSWTQLSDWTELNWSNFYSCVLRDGVACITEQWTNLVLRVRVPHRAERSWRTKALNRLSIAVLPQTDDETCAQHKHRKYSQNIVLQSLLSLATILVPTSL